MSAETQRLREGDSTSSARVREILAELQRRRATGEVVPDEVLIAAHADLMPELGEELRKLRLIAGARQRAAHTSAAETETHDGDSSATGSGCLEVRCPNCHSPTEVAVDTQLTDLTCSACGSHFSLVDQGQATRMAPSLSQLGRFELIERIGVGGFGSVWKARDKELDRTVAIKVPRQGGMTADEQEKFFREARAAAQLKHPSIVSVHEVGRDGDSVYIVSDFVRGVTLSDWLTGQKLTGREAAELCAKIADALQHAHEQGVVHRDLKPANIMIDGDGQPHLMDFGLARRAAGEVTVTMDGQILGTPAYMSPEQALGASHHADGRSDIYSLGVILFQLLTGELPFRGNARMIMHQVVHDEPPSPRKLNSHVKKDLETITLKCLDKDPLRRYQAANELATDLRCFLAGRPIQARPVSRTEYAYRWAKLHPAATALLATLAFVAIAGPLVAVQQTYLRIQNERLSTERQEALSQLDLKNEALQDQLADNLFERAVGEYEDGRVSHAMALLAGALEAATANNSLQESFERLLSAWSTEAPRPLPHDDSVFAVAWGPSGQIVATASADRTARLWDAKTGTMLGQPLPHGAPVRSCAFSPDGRTLATGCVDGLARFWDVDTLQPARTPFAHGASVEAVAYSPDGKFVMTAGGDRAARFWDSETGEQVGPPLRHADGIRAVAFSPDGARMATASFDGIARLWAVDTRKPVGPPMQHRGQLNTVIFSPDSKALVTAGFRDSPKIWNARTGEFIRDLPYMGYVFSAAYSFDGQTVAISNVTGNVLLVDPNSGKTSDQRFHQEGRAWSVASSPIDSSIVVGSTDGIARIWTPASTHTASPIRHAARISAIAVSRDGKVMVTGSDDKTARLWDLQTGAALIPPLQHTNAVANVALSPDNTEIFTASFDGIIRCWDARTGNQIGQPEHGPGYLGDVGFDGNGKRVFAYIGRNAVYLSEDGRDTVRLDVGGTAARIIRLKICLSGGVVAAADNNQRIYAWDSVTGKRFRKSLQHDSGILCLAVAPSGNSLISGCDDATARIWDVRAGMKVGEIPDAGPVVTAVAFSPDEQTVATGNEVRTARLWDAHTGKPLGRPLQHAAAVTSLAFSSDGNVLITGCGDGTIWKWNVPRTELPENSDAILNWARFHSGMILDDKRTPRRLTPSEWHSAQIGLVHTARPMAESDNNSQPLNGLGAATKPEFLEPPLPKIRANIGKFATVELDVAYVSSASGYVTLYASRDIQKSDVFVVLLRESQLQLCRPLGMEHVDQFVGKRIRVNGKVSTWERRPEIELFDLSRQLEVLSDDGSWARPNAMDNRVVITPSLSELRNRVGQIQTVEFRVQSVGGRTVLYLNSKPNFKDADCFTAVVATDQIELLADRGIDNPISQLFGKTVRVTGLVEELNHQIRIQISDVKTGLEVLELDDSSPADPPIPPTSSPSSSSIID